MLPNPHSFIPTTGCKHRWTTSRPPCHTPHPAPVVVVPQKPIGQIPHDLMLSLSLSPRTQHHDIKTMSMRKAGYLSSWPASSCTKRSDIPGGLWFSVPTVFIASPISTSISARFSLSLSLSLSLSRWFMHLWKSKGLELWWVFFNFWQLTYTNAAQKLIVKWNFGFTLQFCLM